MACMRRAGGRCERRVVRNARKNESINERLKGAKRLLQRYNGGWRLKHGQLGCGVDRGGGAGENARDAEENDAVVERALGCR